MSGLGRVRLLARLYRAAPGWSAVVGVLVLLVTTLLVVAPRAAVSAASAELTQAVADVPPSGRDLSANVSGHFVPGPGEAPGLDPAAAEVYGALEEQLSGLATNADPALRDRLGPSDYTIRSGQYSSPRPVQRTGTAIASVRFAFDPRILDRVDVVEGEAPGVPDGSFIVDEVSGLALVELDIMMSVAAAERLDWLVGEERQSRDAGLLLRLSGTFEARDPEAVVWTHVESALLPEVFDDGNAPARATGMAYLAPAALTGMPELQTFASRLDVWYPFDSAGITLAGAQTTVAELRRFTQAREGLPAFDGASLRFSSGTLDAIERVLARSDSTTALLVLLGSGPIGVAGAVLGLAAQGVVLARRPTLQLAAARGASPGALRRALAAEGALVGLPAAALGFLTAHLLVPGPVTVVGVVVAVIVGLAPAAVFAARASFPLRRGDRQDLGASTRSRLRLALDLAVTGLAVLATVLLATGGGTTKSGVDVLAVLAPLLLATAGALLGERLLPAPTGAALAAAAKSPRLPAFLGLARAVRDPGGSIVNLALVVAVAVTAASIVLLTTLDRGTVEASEGALGGDVRAEGAAATEEQLERLADLPGVAHVAGIEAIGSMTFSDGRERLQVPTYLVDGAELAAIQDRLPATLGPGDPIPFLASPALAARLAGEQNTIEGDAAVYTGSAGGAAGIGGGNWVLVDRSASESLGEGAFAPRVVVLGLEPGADSRAVADAVAGVLDRSRVTTLEERIAQQRATPIPGTLRAGFALAIALAALLAVVAILMSARLAGPSRATLARTLHRLGAGRREIAATFATEVVPLTLSSLVVGGALGAVIPLLVVGAVDLAPIVGDIAAPALSADPLALAALVVGALLAGALSILPVLLPSRKESS